MIKGVLDWFTVIMWAKLAKNEHKGGWDQDTIDQLLYKLECEVIELKCQIESGTSRGIVYECVDVANFAMMIADKVRYHD